MNIESTVETNAVVTPNLAMASLSQTTSYTKLQKPETTKKTKYQRIFCNAVSSAWESDLAPSILTNLGERRRMKSSRGQTGTKPDNRRFSCHVLPNSPRDANGTAFGS
jgi:hypothetical protein